MNNAYATSIKPTISINYDKKPSLRERLKKYFAENHELICAGLISMNGGTYIPRRSER